MPKVSVCIPTYNTANYIGQAIESVLMQTYNDYEIVVSDNASEDNTKEIVNSFHDSRIRYFRNEENLGYSKNVRKLIYTLANGEYGVILCADDYWICKDLIKEAVKQLETNDNVGVVFSDTEVRYDGYRKKIIDSKNKGICPGKWVLDIILRGHWGEDLWYNLSSTFFQISIAREVRAYFEDMLGATDVMMWLKMATVCDFYNLGILSSVYRVHSQQLAKEITQLKKYEEETIIFEKMRDFIIQEHPEFMECCNSKNYKEYTKNRVNRILVNSIPSIAVSADNKIDTAKYLARIVSIKPGVLWRLKFLVYSATSLILPQKILLKIREKSRNMRNKSV